MAENGGRTAAPRPASDAPDGGGRPPFLTLRPPRPGLLDRVLRRRPAANAFIELNNLFAGAREPVEVSAGDIDAICLAYGIDVRGTFGARCQALYRDYLHWCLTDRRLSDAELVNLGHLATLLRLDATTTTAIHRSVTRTVYLRTVEEVLEDGAVSDDERAFLRRLGQQLDIPAGTAENMLDMRHRQIRNRMLRPD